MIDKLKKEAMKKGMQLMSSPTFMKMMSDPRVMKAIGQAFALRGQISSEVDAKLRNAAATFGLATEDEVRELRRTISRMESAMTEMEKKSDG